MCENLLIKSWEKVRQISITDLLHPKYYGALPHVLVFPRNIRTDWLIKTMNGEFIAQQPEIPANYGITSGGCQAIDTTRTTWENVEEPMHSWPVSCSNWVALLMFGESSYDMKLACEAENCIANC